MVVPLLGLSLFLGLYPKPVLDRVEPAVELRVRNFERKTDYRQPEPPAIAKEIQRSSARSRRGHGQGRRRGRREVSFAAVSPITPPSVDWLAIAPELALGGAAVLIVLAKALLRRRPAATPVTYAIAAIGVITVRRHVLLAVAGREATTRPSSR